MTARRDPYVGAGADGCRRSAQVDLEEADTLDELNPRREVLAASARAWELQAELEELEATGAASNGRLLDLAGIDVEDGVSAHDGLPFCLVRATAATGDVLVGQLRPAEVRAMALQWLEAAEAATADAAVAHMLAVANAELPDDQRQELVGSALVFLRATRARHEDEVRRVDEATA
jgi:hypothetical protein